MVYDRIMLSNLSKLSTLQTFATRANCFRQRRYVIKQTRFCRSDNACSRVTSIPSETLAVKLHEAGKEVSDMICMQCCRSCSPTDPTVAVPLCGYFKIRHGGAQASDLLGLFLSSLQQVALNRTFALQKHGSRAAETLQKLLRANFVRRTGAATSRLSQHLRSSKRFNRVLLPVAHRNTCALAKVSTG